MKIIPTTLFILVLTTIFTGGAWTQAPAGPSIDLIDTSDSGISNNDNITNSKELKFAVTNVTVGAVVEIYRGGVLRYSMTATQTAVSFTDAAIQEEGEYQYLVRERFNGTFSAYQSINVVVDTVAPGVTIDQASAQPDSTNRLPVRFFIESSEEIVGLQPWDIVLSGTVPNIETAHVNLEGAGNQFLVSVSEITGDGVLQARLAEGSVEDLAGNASNQSTSFDNMVRIDTASPSATISRTNGQLAITKTLPINFSVTFSEPVLDFAASDISLAGSTADVSGAALTLAGTGASYQITINGIKSDGGTVAISLPGGAVMDMATNPSFPASSNGAGVTVDNVAPTVVISHVDTNRDANGSDVTIRVTFSEPVIGYQASEISFGGSNIPTLSNPRTITGSGAVYDVTLHDIKHSGNLVARIFQNAAQDALGNASDPSNQLAIEVSGALVPTFTLEGRVIDSEGRGIRGATVVAIDATGRRTATTSSLGFYRFEALPAGQQIVTVNSRRYRFETRTIGLEANVTSFDFFGLE